MRPLRADRTITTERILREPVEVVLPRKHRLLGKSELFLEDVATEELILCSRIHAPLQYDVIIAKFRAANLVPKVSLETDHIQTVLGLVAAGLGISLLPASVENLRAPGLSCRPLKKPAPHMDMAVAYRRGDPSRTLANFLGLLRELSRPDSKSDTPVLIPVSFEPSDQITPSHLLGSEDWATAVVAPLRGLSARKRSIRR